MMSMSWRKIYRLWRHCLDSRGRFFGIDWALSSIGQLHLLQALFNEKILIPAAVWSEVVEHGGGRPGALQIKSSAWISVRNVQNSDLLQLLKRDLDSGESEAIALAKETNAKLILLDERDARRAALSLSVKPLGTIGVLIRAKQAGKIKSLQEALDALRDQAKFRISDALYFLALEAAGESK